MEEVVCGGALSGARHRAEPAWKKSPVADGDRLPGRRGAPRQCGTRGGAGEDGSGQRPLVADVGFDGFNGWSSASGRPPAGCAREGGGLSGGGRRRTRQLRRQLTGKRQRRRADSGCQVRSSASGHSAGPDRSVGPVLDRGRTAGVGRAEARWREGADVRPRARRGDTDRWVPRDSDFFPT
jgi:hypothetical protein